MERGHVKGTDCSGERGTDSISQIGHTPPPEAEHEQLGRCDFEIVEQVERPPDEEL